MTAIPSVKSHLQRWRRLRRARRISSVSRSAALCAASVIPRLRSAGIAVRGVEMVEEQVEEFARRAEYEFYAPLYYADRRPVLLKKVREHFLAAQLLELAPRDIYLDVASQSSPAPIIYERLFGCTCLRQDLAYPAGRLGRRIGGTAERLPLPDRAVDKIGLHCSFEHFEDRSDVEFLREAERVLRPGGRLAIVSAYVADRSTVFTDPAVLAETPVCEWPVFPEDADVVASASGNRFERYHSPSGLIRLLQAVAGLSPTVVALDDSGEARPGQLKFAVLLEKRES